MAVNGQDSDGVTTGPSSPTDLAFVHLCTAAIAGQMAVRVVLVHQPRYDLSMLAAISVTSIFAWAATLCAHRGHRRFSGKTEISINGLTTRSRDRSTRLMDCRKDRI